MREKRFEQLLGLRTLHDFRSEDHLRQTEQPSGLPASCHLSSVNRGEAHGLFHPR